MADTVITGAGQGIFLVQKGNGRTAVQGLNETRQKFLDMGGDRNLFEKWMKQAAQVAAREATATAPRSSGNLALSVRGFASKKMTIKSRTTGKVTDRMVFGGVITAGSARDRNTESAGGVIDTVVTGVQYARAVSLGTYHNAGTRSKVGGRVWRTTVRGKGNPFMVKARESKKSYMVTLLNFRLSQYIKQKGFETNGL